MPLPSPILDDRSYAQLRDELVRRIPVYNPEWTDHNPSDPGITLLELFAFLGENLLYRFNQIPESTKLAFLKLLRIPLRSATPARTLVAFSNPDAKVGDKPLCVVLGSEAKAGALSFEVGTEVTVAPWRFVAVGRSPSPAPETAEGKDAAIAAIDAMGGLKEGEEPVFYHSDLVKEDPTKPDAAPVDFGAAVDGMIWVAAIGDPGHLPQIADKSLNIGFIPDEEVRSIEDAFDPCFGEIEVRPRRDPCLPSDASGDDGTTPEIVWEVSIAQPDGANKPVYRPLVVVGDTTRGLRQQGVVRLRVPHDTTGIGVFSGITEVDRLGTDALPPLLENKDDAVHVAFWLRAWHRQADHRFGRVLWIGANAAEVENKKKAALETLGTGTGQAGQAYPLVHKPVISGSLVVEVEEQPGQWIPWTPVDGFEASREDDKHFVVELESGEVRFGNGVQGFVPQIGQRIRATEYRYGGGPEGNVLAKAIDKVLGRAGLDLGALKATNPLPARGGAPTEPIAAALERLPGEFRRHDRAVTVSDFRELALGTPGADVGRAECLPLFHPRTGATQAAGVVSVVVWPREDRKHPNAPMPDRTTLRAVCAWLDKRRLVTTELYVIPPTYVPVAVAIGLHVKPGYGADAVRSWVELAVRQYLAPLPPYGPEGGGWPLGRRVYAPEIEAAVLQVEGVEYVDEGQIAVARLAGARWVTGPVLLLPHQVPELSVITVVAGERMDPGTDYSPPATNQKPVPIPTIPEEC